MFIVVTMSDILGDLGAVTTALVGIITQVVNTIVGSPLLLLSLLIGFVFAGVGLFRSIRH